MSRSKGYYSLIQYCPDMSRLEAANVGVLLFCPERRFIQARISHNNDRIRRFFSPEQSDWAQINAMKDSVVRRLDVEADQFQTLEDLERFISLQANELQITPPRPLKTFEPAKDLDKLFSELIGGRSRRTDQEDAEPLRRLIKREFAKEKLDPFLRRDITVNVKALHKTITVPFGFLNGSWNLVQPARFEQTSMQGITRAACELAVQGRSLHTNNDSELGRAQLVVVGAFRGAPAESQTVVRDIFVENDVQLYTTSEMQQLMTKIRQTAKHLP